MPIQLANVTLVAVTSVALEATTRALAASIVQAHFAKALLLSDRPPAQALDPRIEWRQIRPLTTRSDYSRFMLRDLAEHVSTSHALCVQWDGYVLNGEAWDPLFLDYDYIGAIWPHFREGHTVGNGGFSLRSQRLLRATADLPQVDSEPEDVLICRTFRPVLEAKGIKFAGEEIASAFAYERTCPTGNEFGFHGAFNLVRYLSADEAPRLFRKLEPRVLARSEHKELLRWAVNRGYWELALVIALRLIRQRLLFR